MGDLAVAAGVNVNPNAGLDMYSKILGLKQAQQNLQTGQYIQQQQAAAAQQQQQDATEMQNLIPIMRDPVKAGIVDAQGNETPNARNIILAAAPKTGLQKYGDLIMAMRGHTQLANDMLSLGSAERSAFGTRLQGAAINAKNPADIIAAAQSTAKEFEGTPSEAAARRIAQNVTDGVTASASKHGLEGAQTFVTGMVRGNLSPAELSGTGGLLSPELEVNSNQQPIARSRLTGDVSGVSGVNYQGGVVAPPGSTVAGLSGRAVSSGNRDFDAAKEVTSAQQNASRLLPLTTEIDRLRDEIDNGNIAKGTSQFFNYVGASGVNEARAQLVKDLGLVEGTVVSRSGSDARAAAISKGYPTDTTPANTTHAAMDYIRGALRQDLARGRNLSGQKDPNLPGFAGSDLVIQNATNPLHHEYNALKTDKERGAFLKRNFGDRESRQNFVDEVQGIKQHMPEVLK